MKQLAPREREAVEWLCQGMTDREIARHMGICYGAVRKKLESVAVKFGLVDEYAVKVNRVQIALLARDQLDLQLRF